MNQEQSQQPPTILNPFDSVHVAIISSGRPQNVPTMMEWFKGVVAPVWYVKDWEEHARYRAAGATHIVCAGDLVSSRNIALDNSQELGVPCVQLSDDLKRLRYTHDGKTVSAISLSQSIAHMCNNLSDEHGVHLVGVAPTDNAFYFNKQFSLNTFCVGDFIVVNNTSLRFDPYLRLKEDYDYTLQHLRKYGIVVRLNGILATFEHRTNKGGAVEYRNPEEEQRAIKYLKMKWPNNIRDNPKRPNEILMRWNSK